jgi:hypothetical protein
MLLNLLIAVPVMLFGLVLQATFVTIGLRHYLRLKLDQSGGGATSRNILLLSIVTLLMMLSNFVQIAIWAAIFMLLGEFGDFNTALYHSGVNFAGLGYGDIVMSEGRRLLGPIEAANGIAMFGVSTAMITAAVLDIVKSIRARRQKDEGL